MVEFKNTKHSEVQIQVDTDPQVIKVVLKGKGGDNRVKV